MGQSSAANPEQSPYDPRGSCALPYPTAAPSAATAPEGGFMLSSSRAVLLYTAVIGAAACSEAPPTAAPPIAVPPPAPDPAMPGSPLPRLSAAHPPPFA